MRWLILLILLYPLAAFGDSVETPNGTVTSSDNTCDGTPTAHETTDDDPDAPGGDWCVADGKNVSPIFMLNFTDPAIALNNAADAQQIAFYVREYDGGQTGTATVQADIYDGVACIDLHELGDSQNVPDQPGSLLTQDWTSAGISAAADVCVKLTITKSGGAPAAQQSGDLDAIEWRASEAAAATGQIIIIN